MTRIPRLLYPVLAIMAMGVMLGGCFLWPRDAAAGWLSAFIFASAIPLGSLALTMIHRLTGGYWGDAIAPATKVATSAIPFLWIGIIPVLAALPLLFVWVHGGGIRADVQRYYLNVPLYLLRSLIVLTGFTLFGVFVPRRSSPLIAALGLLYYAVAISVIAVDWILTLAPQTMFTAFGASIATEQLAAALAWAILLTPTLSPRTRGDLAGLLIATVLGSLYLAFMDFLVVWYGDVPAKIAWYLTRDTALGHALLTGGFVFGAAIPLAMLIAGRTRFAGDHLRPIAGSLLLGLACFDMWLIVPVFGRTAAAFAITGIVLVGALALGALRGAFGRSPEVAHG